PRWARRAVHRGDRHQHAAESFQIAARVLRVAHVDGEAIAPLDGRADRGTADGGLDGPLHVAHGQAVTPERVAKRNDVDVQTALVALVQNAAGAADGLEQRLQPDADLLDLREIGPHDPPAHRRPD